MPIVLIIVAIIGFALGRAFATPAEAGVRVQKPGQSMNKAQAYKVLAVAPTASETEIKDAYRKLLQKLHPDQGGSAYLMDLVLQAKNTLIKEG